MSSIMSTLARRSLISGRISRLLTRQHHCSPSSSSCSRKPSPSTSSLFHPIRFSSSSTVATRPSSDQKLSRVLESELQCAIEERDDLDQGGLVPEGFPSRRRYQQFEMAFSSILLRGGSSIAARAVGASKSYYYTYSAAPATKFQFLSPTTTNFLPHNHFSLGAVAKDENLVRVIQSEIKCSLESDDHNRVEEVPNGFPFKIEDIPGQATITLKREYSGEDIKVEVHMPNLVTGDEDDDGDGDEDDDVSEKANQASIPLVVTVSKKSGPCLEFGVTAFPDEVAIDSMSVKEQDSSEDKVPYEGPDFTGLDENLQKTFHKYLEIRGIKPITTNYLYEYMINKDSREYLRWLNNLKEFVEN